MRAPSLTSLHKHLPSVDAVLKTDDAESLIAQWGHDLVVFGVRQALEMRREKLVREKSSQASSPEMILVDAKIIVERIGRVSLVPVINATGIILHTNLGRAPLGDAILDAIAPVVRGYSNVEFNTEEARRGRRLTHVAEILSFLTGAQSALVVNNNAAALILALHTLAHDREAVISRGELIEIGGAFRIPDIMAASGAKMVEVGTTNRTRASDYEQAITPHTAMLFKAHKSNYTIAGFTEEVSITELASLSHAHHMPLLYDIGSGLLRKPKISGVSQEPDVRTALSNGADLVAFSGDKLLGGPQAGILVGRRDLIDKLAKAPLMRALRVGKLTLAALSQACRHYLDETTLLEKNPLFALLERPVEKRRELAEVLLTACDRNNVPAEIVESTVQCGGGTLPDLRLPGFAVALKTKETNVKKREQFARMVFHRLLQNPVPVLGVLREGRLLFDTGALFDHDVDTVADAIAVAGVLTS
jgi:L-seryl-tRNA(Ser) seleniumtransferase